jgi:hypothetical protein
MKFLRTVVGFVGAAMLVAGCLPEKPKPSVAMNTPADTSAAPSASTIPLPTYVVDSKWSYSDGYAIRVSEVSDNGRAKFVRTDAEDQWFVRKAIFREESQSRKIHRLVVFRTADPMALFSAKPNKPIVHIREYMRNGELVRHRTSWVIEGKEKITVPAGTFDTWVLVMRTQSLTSNWRGYERWYYSPKISGYARLEFKYGEAPDGARVLMSYNLAEPAEPGT